MYFTDLSGTTCALGRNYKHKVWDSATDKVRWENRNHDWSCLVPRRLSFDENVRAKEGGKETTGETRFACRLYTSHGPLGFITSHSFRARFCLAKNEAPEEEAVTDLKSGSNKTAATV